MNPDIKIIILSLIPSVGLFLIAMITLILTKRFRLEPSFIQQIGNIHNFCMQEYQDKKLDSPITINKSVKHSIKEIRNEIKKDFIGKNNEPKEHAKKRFFDSTLNEHTWQNRATYQISSCLQRIGLMVLIGGIPLGYILASNGYQIIQDWIYCNKLVNMKIRTKSPIRKGISNGASINFYRRHGEWLAYSAAIYMNKYWKDKNDNVELKEYLNEIGDINQLIELEKKIRKSEAIIIPKNINKSIERLLY